MPIKNGRYKDSKGVVRHFETNENMVVVDDGQKTLKQKLKEIKDRAFTKNDVGLSNVDNTSDLGKPVSTATQTELSKKADKTYVDTQDRALDSKITVLSCNSYKMLEVLDESSIHKTILSYILDKYNKGYTTFEFNCVNSNQYFPDSPSDLWGVVRINCVGGFIHCEYLEDWSGIRCTRKIHKNDITRWYEDKWKQVATTDKIDNLPLLNGWVSEIFPATVARNGNSISIDAMIRLGSTATGASFFYLPEGFRPSNTRYFIAHTSYAKTPILIDVHPSGQVVPNSDQSVSNQRVVINTTINI